METYSPRLFLKIIVTSRVLLTALSISVAVLYVSPHASAASITLNSPNGGECYLPGSTVSISWTSTTDINDVALGVRPMDTTTIGTQSIPPAWNTLSNPETTWNIVHGSMGNSYSWNVPTTISTSTGYYLWIEAHGIAHERVALDSSDSLFGFSTTCSTSTTGTMTGAMPIAPTALHATTPVEGSVTFSWTDNATDENDYKVYRRTSGSSSWNLQATLPVNSTSYSETSVPSGTYEYQVWACNTGGCSGSAIVSVSIAASVATTTTSPTSDTSSNTTSTNDTTAPVISTVRVENNTNTGAQIKWATDDPSDSRVYFGTSANSLTIMANGDCFGGSLLVSHCANLTGLTLETRYYYRVESKNAGNLNSASAVYDFVAAASTTSTTTQPAPSPTPSTVSPIPTPQVSPAIMTRVTGKIFDPQGRGVPDAWVWGRNLSTEKFVQTKTTSMGMFDIEVLPGTWEFNISLGMSVEYAYQGGSKHITIELGATQELNFELMAFDATLTGAVVDTLGNSITDIQGYVSLSKRMESTTMASSTAGSVQSFGSAINQGGFTIKAPAGTYYLHAYFPSDSHYNYTPQGGIPITLEAGRATPYILLARGRNALITGVIQDAAGVPVKGISPEKMRIYASREGGSWYNGNISSTTGTYEIKVSEGIWNIGFWIDQSTGYATASPDTQVTVSAAKPVNHTLRVIRAGSTITGRVTTEEGAPLSNVWISLSSRSIKSGIAETTHQTSPYLEGITTDSEGQFSLSVPAGTYYLYTSSRSALGYLGPDETIVTIAHGETITQNLIFRKSNLTVRGTTRIDGVGLPAFVWAWGETGGYVQTESSSTGLFSLPLTKNTLWHITASRETSNGFFRAAEIEVDTRALTPPPADLTMVPIKPLAQAVEHTIEAAKIQSVELSDGARVVVPANALTATGTAHISVAPTIQVPSLPTSSVVGTSYNIEATTAQGDAITSLSSEITITIPYDDDELTSRGITPEALVLSYFDEKTNSWQPVEKQVIDKANRIVIGTVNHLTVFALIAPADTVPPPAPTNMAITREGTTITLSWKNPTVDFNHIKIYQSQTLGSLGVVAFNYLIGNTQLDTTTETSYYTIHAVDLSGNESQNITQLKTPDSNTMGIAINSLARTLRQGSRGSDVAILQSFLIMTNYLQDKADGIFGPKTWNAVRNFQRAQSLAVDGIAGPKTHARIRALALLGNYSQTP